jgi:hypothetical protein
MNRHNLKYKTFEQVLAEVKSDFEAYNLEDLIKPHHFIKVVKRVNYELGLRINITKNIVLEIENGRAKLPNDFLVVNYVLGLGEYEVVVPVVQGTHVEEVPLNAPTYHPGSKTIDVCAVTPTCPTPEPHCPDPCQAPNPCGCNTCNCSTWINCKGEEMTLIQKIKYETRKWKEFYRIKMVPTPYDFDPLCPNLSWHAGITASIRDGYLWTSFKTGRIYLNYQGMLEDEHGNLLVLDHDYINEFYEYAMKERLLEILMANKETVDPNFVARIDAKLRGARNNSMSIVNTPDFAELKEVWHMNRLSMFNKYYKMFM